MRKPEKPLRLEKGNWPKVILLWSGEMAVPNNHTIFNLNAKKLRKQFLGMTTYRGIVAIILAIFFWEFATWVNMPVIGAIPPPHAVISALGSLLQDSYYWESWFVSFKRVFLGFIVAQMVGIPLGLIMGLSRNF